MNYLVQSSIMPQEGHYYIEKITKEEFIQFIRDLHSVNQIQSAIQYENTCKYIQKITGIRVKRSRKSVRLNNFSIMIICKLSYRPGTVQEKKKYKTKSEITDKDVSFYLCRYSYPINTKKTGDIK